MKSCSSGLKRRTGRGGWSPKGDNTSCYEKITQLGSLFCARVDGVTISMTGVAGVLSTAGTAQPFWLDRVPRVARLEADMLTFV
jgi:hypothetical protein